MKTRIPCIAAIFTCLSILFGTGAALADVSPDALLVYYGWPSGATPEGASDPDPHAVFSAFDVVVLGATLEEPDHDDHQATRDIIAALPDTAFYGYIDLDARWASAHTDVEIGLRLALWAQMGVAGVLLDDFGYDYNVSRARQNAAVEGAHALGLKVIANGWDPDHVFGNGDFVYTRVDDKDIVTPVAPGTVAGSLNADGTPTALGPDDAYLLESYQVIEGQIVDAATWRARADEVAAYRAQLGFDLFSVTTAPAFDPTQFDYAFLSAVLDEHDAMGWGGPSYYGDIDPSAVVIPVAPANPGDTFITDLGASVWYTRRTDVGEVWVDPGSGVGGFFTTPLQPIGQAYCEAIGYDLYYGDWAGGFCCAGDCPMPAPWMGVDNVRCAINPTVAQGIPVCENEPVGQAACESLGYTLYYGGYAGGFCCDGPCPTNEPWTQATAVCAFDPTRAQGNPVCPTGP